MPPYPRAATLAIGATALGRPPLRVGIVLVYGTSTGAAPMGGASAHRRSSCKHRARNCPHLLQPGQGRPPSFLPAFTAKM
ncbi:hypothetical protein BHM03_00058809 [Ensete ventricosum]|nr:hypothetical protein BHM03_00058809 [Ensete ventricosum]